MSKIVEIDPRKRAAQEFFKVFQEKLAETPIETIQSVYVTLKVRKDEGLETEEEFFVNRVFNIDYDMIGYIMTDIQMRAFALRDEGSLGPDYDIFGDEEGEDDGEDDS